MAHRRHVVPALGNQCEVTRREEKEIEIWKVCKLCLKGKFYMSTSSRKLKWLFEDNAQHRDDYLRLKLTWKEVGNEEMLIWLFMKPIKNSNLKDWNCARRISGLISLKEKRLIYAEKWK